MSVNNLLTFINHNCNRRKEDYSSLETSHKYTDVYQTYIKVKIRFSFQKVTHFLHILLKIQIHGGVVEGSTPPPISKGKLDFFHISRDYLWWYLLYDIECEHAMKGP